MQLSDYLPDMKVWDGKRKISGTVVKTARTRVHAYMTDETTRTYLPDELESLGDEPITFALREPATVTTGVTSVTKPATRLTSTRELTDYAKPKPRPNQNAKTRRMLRRNGPASVARMMLRG